MWAFNFVDVALRNWPFKIPVGSQKVVLNDGILKNLLEQTLPKIKFKKYYISKKFHNFCLISQQPSVQPMNKSWAHTVKISY